MNDPIRIVRRAAFTAVGIRVTVPSMDQLGPAARDAWLQLQERKREIPLIRDEHRTFGLSPPNYKGNPGPFDFYVGFEVERIERLPYGMVHLRLPARQYAEVEYRGPMNDERTRLLDGKDATNVMKALSPVKPSAGPAFPTDSDSVPVAARAAISTA